MRTLNLLNPFLKNRLPLVIIAILLVLALPGKSQSQSKNTLLQMIDEDRTTIDAIAGCEKKIQPHLLLVSQTPELLNKIEELQKRSQDQFKNIIERYDRDAQAAFYDIARYPNMISDLVNHGRPSESEVDRIVLNYPQEIRDVTKRNAIRYFDVLLQIERLNNEIDRAFRNALASYPVQTQESVNVLLAYPEIVSALVNDKPFTTVLGEVYREDPAWLNNQIAQISNQLGNRNREDLEAYRNQIQKDPEAYNEMLDASDKFSSENKEVRYLNNYQGPVVEAQMVNSYPYWFGYPYWYSDPYWRPRPVYYHTGIYRNQYGNIEIVGLPSGFFLHWHSEYHPRMYPHLTYNYYNFYENHYMKRFNESPRSFPRQGFYRSIENNVINNPRVNNRSLERIDRQRGSNFVHRPNVIESSAPQGGSSAIIRSGRNYNAGQGLNNGGTTIPQNTQRQNGVFGAPANQGQFNTASPTRSEGNVVNPGNNPPRRDVRYVPGQQNNVAAPASQNNNNAAPASQNNNNAAPAPQNYNRPAPAQQNYNRPAPAQQNYSRPAPAQQNYSRPAPAPQNYNRAAPVQQNNSRQAPAQQNRVVPQSAPAKSSGSSDRSKPEKERRREQ